MGKVSQASLHTMSMQHREHSTCRHKGRKRDEGEGRRREKEKEEGRRRKEGGERLNEKDGGARTEDKEGGGMNKPEEKDRCWFREGRGALVLLLRSLSLALYSASIPGRGVQGGWEVTCDRHSPPWGEEGARQDKYHKIQ